MKTQTTFTTEQLASLTKRQKNMVILAEEYSVDFPTLITPDEEWHYVSENRVIIGHDFAEYMAEYFMNFESEILQSIPSEDFEEEYCEISGHGNRQYCNYGDGEEIEGNMSGEICDFSSYVDFEEENERRFYFHEYIDSDGRPIKLYDMIVLSEIE